MCDYGQTKLGSKNLQFRRQRFKKKVMLIFGEYYLLNGSKKCYVISVP